jgi:hypothetical protein
MMTGILISNFLCFECKKSRIYVPTSFAKKYEMAFQVFFSKISKKFVCTYLAARCRMFFKALSFPTYYSGLIFCQSYQHE